MRVPGFTRDARQFILGVLRYSVAGSGSRTTRLDSPDLRREQSADPDSSTTPVHRLLAYWLEKRGDRLFPAKAEIDPVEFPYILGYVTLVEVER